MRQFYLLCSLICAVCGVYAQQINNFSKNGKQITKFDDLGKAVDAHDGEIAYFDGTYYLFGTSYDCGFEWNNKEAPFCGFKSYSSKDMVNWKDEGFLFDAQVPLWQKRCDGKTYGCFRPHVIYNRKNKNYVLWVNVYDNVSGYRVFTSPKPTGPYTEVAEPKIEVNRTMPAAGLNNGDHDLFIDDDGKGYLAFTDWRTKGTIVVEQLTEDYLSGNGNVTKGITSGNTEAPALFKRKGIYYLTYSDPNCGYCAGTGTSYKTAKSPMGPWSEGIKISDNSCGGQPSFVSTMKIGTETIYLYGSDLWNNAAKNEALANFYWAPLTFNADGSIQKMECLSAFSIPKNKPAKTNSQQQNFTAGCDVGGMVQRSQSFKANQSGTLNSFAIATLKSGYPDQDLVLAFYEADQGKISSNKLLKELTVSPEVLGWSAKETIVQPMLKVEQGKEYIVVLKSASTRGCFGFAIGNTDNEVANGFTARSADGGSSFKQIPTEQLKYSYKVE